MDAFTKVRARLASEAARRDEVLARRDTYRWMLAPQTFNGEARYVNQDARDAETAAHDRKVSHARQMMRASHKRRVTIRVSGINGYWGNHLHAAAVALIDADQTDYYEWLAWIAPRHGRTVTSNRLTSQARDIIRFIRNSAKREAIAAGELLANGEVVTMPSDPMNLVDAVQAGYVQVNPKRGMEGVSGMGAARETRVNVRGAYGKRTVKVQPNKRVSSADNRKPVMLLAPLLTVGIATHPDASAADYDLLIRHTREDPKLASVRVYTPGDSVGKVIAVSDYADAAQAATDRFKASKRILPPATVIPQAMHAPDLLRYAAIIGYAPELAND